MSKELDIFLTKYDLSQFSGIYDNFNEVLPEGIFCAIKGANFDGNLYWKEAFDKGAKVIITDQKDFLDQKGYDQRNFFLVKNVRDFLIQLAEKFYHHMPEYIVAITGTNGKSSVVHYLTQIFNLLSLPAASIGTLGLNPNYNIKYQSELTTPDLLTLYKTLNQLKTIGVNHVALEASSHALKQGRLGKIKLLAAGFTSFSLDHQDYHQDLEDYLKSKKKLFDYLLNTGFIVLNGDMSSYSSIVPQNCSNVFAIFHQQDNKNVNHLSNVKSIFWHIKSRSPNNNLVEFIHETNRYNFNTSLIPDFQIVNLLISLILVRNITNIDFNTLLPLMEQISPPKGRLERVNIAQDSCFKVFVDYCHTPESLELTLKALRQKFFVAESESNFTNFGRLIVVFGCGGERDQSKRPIMGKIAQEYADIVIITDDNPRKESSCQIRAQILSGCTNKAIEIADREEAIAYAIKNLKPEDLLLLAGKGHEDYQLIGNNKIQFEDAKMAKKYMFKYNKF